MKNHRLVLPFALFTPALFAQEHTIAIKAQGDTPTRYTIEATSKIETTTKRLVNGEEANFGRGGAGGGGGRGAAQGPTSAQQKIVFVDGGSWRQYETAEAKVTRPGWDGETSEQTVTGELQGKKVSLGAEPAVMGEGDKTTPLPANASRGLPRKIDFSGLAPSKPLALNGTYEIGASFKQALASLAHPIRAARGEGGGNRGEGGGRANRGAEGGEGGGAAGGRGARGQGRGGMGGAGGDNAALQILTAEGAQPKLTGKLVKVENNIATIEISGDVTGKGDPQKLGLGGGANMRGRGRGGEGGEGAEPPAPAVADGTVKVGITGTLTVDISSGTLQSLQLNGKLDTKSHVEMTMERQGESMDMETDETRKGDFAVKVAAAPAK